MRHDDDVREVPWTVEGIADAFREVGAWIATYRNHAPESSDPAEHAQKLIDNIGVLRTLLDRHPVGDARHNADVALTATERRLRRIVEQPAFIGKLYREAGRDAPEQAVVLWMDDDAALECERLLESAADEIDTVGKAAERGWITHSEALMAFDRLNAANLTMLCNKGKVRCVGKGKARRIDANSLARYLTSKVPAERDEPETDEDIRTKLRKQGL